MPVKDDAQVNHALIMDWDADASQLEKFSADANVVCKGCKFC